MSRALLIRAGCTVLSETNGQRHVLFESVQILSEIFRFYTRHLSDVSLHPLKMCAKVGET